MMKAKRSKHVGGVVSLPEEIIFEVLARLPAKPLCRFRCASKGWRALISDQAFVAAQRSRAGPHLVGVFYVARRPPEVRVMDMDGNVVRVFAITSSTPPPHLPSRMDLFCVDGDMIVDPIAGRACTMFSRNDPVAMAISNSTSFGHAAPSGAFKVLLLQHPYTTGGGPQVCNVATIMDGVIGTELPTWRLRSAPPLLPVLSVKCEHKAIVNGVIYFMPYELRDDLDVNDDDDDDDGDDDTASSWNHIAAFDLESEKWATIHGPALGLKEGKILSITLAELKGTLAMVQNIHVDDCYYASIWLLLDPNMSVWVKECTMQMLKNLIRPKPLGSLVDGRILLMVGVFEEEERRQVKAIRDVVLFYNPSTKAFSDLMEMVEVFRDKLYFYTGSLLS